MRRLAHRRVVAVAGLACLAPDAARAFVPIPCPDGSGGLAHYATAAPPAVGLSTGDPGYDGEAREAMAPWNQVQQAGAALAEAPAGGGCALDDGGQPRVTWDSGECGGLPPEVLAWTLFRSADGDACLISESDVVFNGAAPVQWTSPLVHAVALHELGHFLLLDHEWAQLSVMGYWHHDAPPPLFLFADDVAGARSLYPEAGPATEDLQLHGYRLLELPVPGVESFGYSDRPSCTRPDGALRDCRAASTGGTVGATFSVENVGGSGHEGPLTAQLTLVDRTSGTRFLVAEASWDSFPAATSWSGLLEGELGPGIPDGSYDAELRLDPALLAPDDPAPERHLLLLVGRVDVNLAHELRSESDYLAPDPPEPVGCGCGVGGDGIGLVALAALLGIRGRRRGRR